MRLREINDMRELQNAILQLSPDYIVLEGYNAVGKGRVIEQLSNNLNYRVYRPNYNSWANEVPREYRWAIFSSFLDISSSLGVKPKIPVIFDRGFFSGVVYNDDPGLAEYYSSIVKDARVLHILVTCSEEDYQKFLKIRGSEKALDYSDCLYYTRKYTSAFESAGADFIEYNNIFIEGIDYREICAGCSHYTSYDNCCHNEVAIKSGVTNVSHDRKRCAYASMKEIQDGTMCIV